jgi:hypothetical protein
MLLLNPLATVINLVVAMEFKVDFVDGSETFDLFCVEFHTFSKNMR